MDPEDTWLTIAELAARLHQTEDTIRYWRRMGTGPAGTRFGRRVLYRLTTVRAWETEREQAQAAGRAS